VPTSVGLNHHVVDPSATAVRSMALTFSSPSLLLMILAFSADPQDWTPNRLVARTGRCVVRPAHLGAGEDSLA